MKVTPPNQFNDPFEFTPNIYWSDPVGYVNHKLENESVLKDLYDNDPHPSGFEAFLKLVKTDQAKLIEQFVRLLPDEVPELEKEFLDRFSKEVGVLCMSGLRDAILMWGHYCDKPRGLVVGFDKSCPVFQQGKGLRPVHYVKQRVLYDACWNNPSPEMTHFTDGSIVSKNADWTYENEFRQILELSSPLLEKKPLEDGTTGYFLGFPPAAIVSVTLGPRVSSECESEVKEILRKPHFSKVKLDRAILNKCDFKLEFAPVT